MKLYKVTYSPTTTETMYVDAPDEETARERAAKLIGPGFGVQKVIVVPAYPVVLCNDSGKHSAHVLSYSQEVCLGRTYDRT